jgi:hypothetical protein
LATSKELAHPLKVRDGDEELSDEEQSARAKEAAEKKKELEDKGIFPKINEELEEDKPVTPLGNE